MPQFSPAWKSRFARLRLLAFHQPHVGGALIGIVCCSLALWSPAPRVVLPLTALLALWASAALSRRTQTATLATAPETAKEQESQQTPESELVVTEPDGPPDMRIRPPHVCVADTGTVRGRGVYAERAFTQGELVEAAPVTVFDTVPGQHLPRELKLLIFRWVLGSSEKAVYGLAHGYVSMLNHDSPANCMYTPDTTRGEIRVYALRDIRPGEELTVNYNCGQTGRDEDSNTDWFAANGVQRSEARVR